jgi:hypothetical protein
VSRRKSDGALPARNGRGSFTKSIGQRDLDREAARLYQRYSSYREVAALMGCEVATAFNRVRRALYDEPTDDIAVAKRIALNRLDAQAVIAQAIAEEEHPAVSHGHVVYAEDAAGNRVRLRDRMPNLAALDRLHRIEDQRHRLLGTYSPLKSRVEVIPAEVIEARVRENEAMIAAIERELGLGSGTNESVAAEGSGDS